MFSRNASRLHGETNPLYRLLGDLQSRGIPVSDLISGNVTEYGIVFPQDLLEEILARSLRECRVYRPDSFGQLRAREAISEFYRNHGVSVPAGQILLTPGTSISYWYCFKLLADDGDEILCPTPSYPLFDYIAALSGVRLMSYPLREDGRWSIDTEKLEACVSTRTRAIVLISPHNPTGKVASKEEIEQIAEIALRHDLAIISDEVFSEFLPGCSSLPRPAGSTAPLIFTLNGFSKMLALPGIKLGWMGVSGLPDRVAPAMRALELISDTFLPVNEVVQAAVPALMREGKAFLEWYQKEVDRRWAKAEQILRSSSRCEFLAPEGGFYVTLRLKDLDEERCAMEILREEYLLLHPGYFYDMKPHHLVLTFVQQPEIIEQSLARIVTRLEQTRSTL